MQSQTFEVFADYHQFYLWDEDQSPDAPGDWNDVDVSRRLKVAPYIVVMCPARNYTVPVEVRIHEEEPSYEEELWNHIAECSLDLPSGKLEIHECTGGSVAHFGVEPGCYRVRAFHAGLGSIGEDETEGDDHYLIELWKAPAAELHVIKEHSVA